MHSNKSFYGRTRQLFFNWTDYNIEKLKIRSICSLRLCDVMELVFVIALYCSEQNMLLILGMSRFSVPVLGTTGSLGLVPVPRTDWKSRFLGTGTNLNIYRANGDVSVWCKGWTDTDAIFWSFESWCNHRWN